MPSHNPLSFLTRAVFCALLVPFIFIQSNLSGTFTPFRRVFPALCELHFENNLATTYTWLEANNQLTIAPFRDYLKFIPRVYVADCYHCTDCKGFGLNMYNDLYWPVDDEVDAFKEISKGHQKTAQGWNKHCKNDERSDHCKTKCWDGGYFRKWNQKYIHFFQHYLHYCSENQECCCYWPELNLKAVLINDKVYELFEEFAFNQLINSDYSDYWNANVVDYKGKIAEGAYRIQYHLNSYGMASSLTTYTFFYSQYHQILLSVASFIDESNIFNDSESIDQIYNTLESLKKDFTPIYNDCIKAHPHPKIFYERGMIKLHSGQIEDALLDIQSLFELAKTDHFKDQNILTSDMYQQEGQAYADIGLYDNAIASLDEAIRLNPGNRGAYFDRAQAYFEVGNFDQALSDYLNSNQSSKLSIPRRTSLEFEKALLKSLVEGGKDSALEFIPSLYNSAYGMGEALWIFTQDPITSTSYFANTCYEVSQNFYDYFSTLDWNKLEGYSNELQKLYVHYESLSDTEKGELIGYVIGKYGTDIFAGGATIKAIAAFKKLKSANNLYNLEALASSETNKKAITASAVKHASKKSDYISNVKIHWGRQLKHVEGSNNYQKGKSIFQHPNPEKLLKEHGGKGLHVRGVPGEAGYQELVNFNEHIGLNVCEKTGKATATTWGKIHYSKDGAHIVPTAPRS